MSSTSTVTCGTCGHHQIDVLGAAMAKLGFVGCTQKPVWEYQSAVRPRQCVKFVVQPVVEEDLSMLFDDRKAA